MSRFNHKTASITRQPNACETYRQSVFMPMLETPLSISLIACWLIAGLHVLPALTWESPSSSRLLLTAERNLSVMLNLKAAGNVRLAAVGMDWLDLENGTLQHGASPMAIYAVMPSNDEPLTAAVPHLMVEPTKPAPVIQPPLLKDGDVLNVLQKTKSRFVTPLEWRSRLAFKLGIVYHIEDEELQTGYVSVHTEKAVLYLARCQAGDHKFAVHYQILPVRQALEMVQMGGKCLCLPGAAAARAASEARKHEIPNAVYLLGSQNWPAYLPWMRHPRRRQHRLPQRGWANANHYVDPVHESIIVSRRLKVKRNFENFYGTML